jgi:hypothetical protein
MPDFLTAPFANGPAVSPLDVVVRLLASLALGGAVAWIYGRTRRDGQISTSFASTLVLLSILIAMVTQVIGDNVARAFSLVGALSIVRFRTVVRDTEDTAYVIFAVVVGMAVGAKNVWVAVIGLAVVGLAAFFLMIRRNSGAGKDSSFILHLRVGIGKDPEELLAHALNGQLNHQELLSLETTKQGIALEATFHTNFRQGVSPGQIVKTLNHVEGVQSVSLERRGLEEI